MENATNLAVVKKAYHSFQAGDIQGVLDTLHDDALYQYNNVEQVPFNGQFKGKQEILRFFQLVAGNVDLSVFDPQEYIDGGNTIVIVGREKATSKATGKTIDVTFVHIADLADGKITRLRMYPDKAGGASLFS